MKVMIAAGGTGGHIYPALALAEEIMREPENEVIFFGSNSRMEAEVIPARGYPFYGLSMAIGNGGLRNKAAMAASLVKAQKKALRILKKEKPDFCVGFGNYISVPLILAAHRLHIPTMLHEQNSFAGKANRFLGPWADAAAGCYDSNIGQLPKKKTRILGNPAASQAAHTVFDPACIRELGLDPDIPFVIFMMGSLGSSSVSAVVDDAIDLFDPSYQVIIAKGTSNEYEYRHASEGNVRIVPYVDGKMMLNGCALAVTRAGATTIAEIAAVGTPSVLVPSPYVPNNHQYYNALELSEKGAAVLIEEKDLNASVLAAEVNRIMADDELRRQMRDNAYRLGKRNAAEEMVRWMKEIAYGR